MSLQESITTWQQSSLNFRLHFSGSVSEDICTGPFVIKPNQPDCLFDKRIYCYYDPSRFLELTVPSNWPKDKFIKCFSNCILYCVTRYRFFWCDINKSPQSYSCFAESGVGIPRSEECTFKMLQNRCLTRDCNPELSIPKGNKQIKLSFSTTTEGHKIESKLLFVTVLDEYFVYH